MGSKDTLKGSKRLKIANSEDKYLTFTSIPPASMTRKMVVDVDEAIPGAPSGATDHTNEAMEGGNMARRPTSLLTAATLNTPTLNTPPGFPFSYSEATPTLVITPNTLNSLLEVGGFTPTTLHANTTFVEAQATDSVAQCVVLQSANIISETVSNPQNMQQLTSAIIDRSVNPTLDENSSMLPMNLTSRASAVSMETSHVSFITTDTTCLSQNASDVLHESIYVTENNSQQHTATASTSSSPSCSKRSSATLDDLDQGDLEIEQSLADAAVSALTTGSLTPLVKEELKYSIQNKRLRTGKNELTVEYNEPEPEKLSAEEEEKRKRRRDRNRVAAQKCRNRRRNKMQSLEEESKELMGDNSKLKKQIRQLELEKQKLSLVMRCHDFSDQCPSHSKLSTSDEVAAINDIPSVASSSSELTHSVFGGDSETDTSDSADEMAASYRSSRAKKSMRNSRDSSFS